MTLTFNWRQNSDLFLLYATDKYHRVLHGLVVHVLVHVSTRKHGNRTANFRVMHLRLQLQKFSRVSVFAFAVRFTGFVVDVSDVFQVAHAARYGKSGRLRY